MGSGWPRPTTGQRQSHPGCLLIKPKRKDGLELGKAMVAWAQTFPPKSPSISGAILSPQVEGKASGPVGQEPDNRTINLRVSASFNGPSRHC